MGFDEFINKPVSEKVLLLEVEPAVEADVWTISGQGPEYYTTFEEMLVNEYAAVSKVCEDGKELTEGSGIGSLDAGQWYHDLDNKRVYVRTEDSSDPSTKVMAIYFKVYFATTGKVFNSNYYQPRVKEGGVKLSAGRERIDSGSLVLVNSDGWFDVKMVKWVWRGADCIVRLGGDDLVYSDYNVVVGLKVCGMEYKDVGVVLELEGAKSNWNIQLPINEFYTSEETLRPNANGTYNEWAGGYADVDDTEEPKGDKWGSYVKLTSGTGKESFHLQDMTEIPDGAVINFVVVTVCSRVLLDTDNLIDFGLRIGGNDYMYETEKYAWSDNSWERIQRVWRLNPADEEAWEKEDINALEVVLYGDVKEPDQELYVTMVKIDVNYSVMEQYGEGKAVPIVYAGEGGVEYSPVLIDDTVEHGKFGLADHTVQTLKAVDKVWYEGELLTGEKYSVSLTYCTLTILTAGPVISDPSALKVRVRGARVSDIPEKQGDDSPMVRAPDIVRHLFQVVLGWGVGKINTGSFDTARAVATQANKLVINEKMYLKDIVERLVQSVKGVFGQGKDGKLFMNIWSADDTGALELEDEDILSFSCKERDFPIARRLVVKYGRDPNSGEYRVVSAMDLWAERMFPRTDIKVFETTLAEKGDAQSLAVDLLPSYNVGILDCEVVTKLKAAKVAVGDKVKITKSRAPSLSGSFVGEVFQVRGVSRETGNRIKLVLEPNKYFGCSMSAVEDKGEYDKYEAISRALGAIAGDTGGIKPDRVVTESIKNLAITAEKIANLAITAEKIGSLAITSEKIDSLAITSEKIGASAVTSGKIEDLAITVGKIGAQAVYVGKLATDVAGLLEARPGRNLLDNPGFEDGSRSWETGTGISFEDTGGDGSNKCLKLTRSGSDIANDQSNLSGGLRYFEVNPGDVIYFGGSFKSGNGLTTSYLVVTVTDKDKANPVYSLTTPSTSLTWETNTQTYTIPANKKFITIGCRAKDNDGDGYFDNLFLKKVIQTNDLGDFAVTVDKIANLAIATGKIANLAIATGKIANLAVTAEKIANGTITATEIANLTISADKIVNLTITAAKIENEIISNTRVISNNVSLDSLVKYLKEAGVYVETKHVQAGVYRALKYIDGDGTYKGALRDSITGFEWEATVYKMKVVKQETFGEAPVKTRYYLGFTSDGAGGGGGTGEEPPEGNPEY